MANMEKWMKLPKTFLTFKNFTEFNRCFLGEEDRETTIDLRSGKRIHVSYNDQITEIADIYVYGRFGKEKNREKVLDFSPGTGAFSLFVAGKSGKVFALEDKDQRNSQMFNSTLALNSGNANNIERISLADINIPPEVSILEHVFEVKGLETCSLLHLNCVSYDQYDLLYKTPTKLIPRIKEFCISYKDIDKERGYDMENLVRYIATTSTYKMNNLFVRGDGTGTIWLSQR